MVFNEKNGLCDKMAAKLNNANLNIPYAQHNAAVRRGYPAIGMSFAWRLSNLALILMQTLRVIKRKLSISKRHVQTRGRYRN